MTHKHLSLFWILAVSSALKAQNNLASPSNLYPSPSGILSEQVLSQKFNMPSSNGQGGTIAFITNNWDHGNGLGLIMADNVASPIVWMYEGADRNAFTVAKKGFSNAQGEAVLGNYIKPLFQIRENGKVGINTVSPRERIDVWGGAIAVTGEDHNGTALITSIGGTALFGNNNYSNGIAVLPDGKVGIGTYTPGLFKLAVNGDIKSYNYDNNTGISIGAENSERPRIGFHVSDNHRRFKIEFNDVNQPSERLGIFTNNGGAWPETEVFSISKIGNVGVGTIDTKGYKLAVNGDAIFTKIKVRQYGNWPDYVFDNDYKVPTLAEVEAFIKQNKHLPEVPSARVVEEKGLDLGDNQAVLLKKIEELTLYIIEQNKRIEKLETSNIQLVKENQAIKDILQKIEK